jgi:hypothetical protein
MMVLIDLRYIKSSSGEGLWLHSSAKKRAGWRLEEQSNDRKRMKKPALQGSHEKNTRTRRAIRKIDEACENCGGEKTRLHVRHESYCKLGMA